MHLWGNLMSKYPYKARQNALLSIQLYSVNSTGNIDLKVTSNMSDETDKLFPRPEYDFDALRHGKFAAESIMQFADGRALAFMKVFVASLHKELNLKADAQVTDLAKPSPDTTTNPLKSAKDEPN